MLYLPKSRIFKTVNRPITAGTILSDEGMALVAGAGGTVRASAGTVGEKFVGVSVFQRGPLITMPQFIEFTPATGAMTITLTNQALGGTLSIRNATTNAALVETTDYTYDQGTNTVTFLAPAQDVPTVIGYEYSPTMMQAKVIQGDVQPGGTVPANYGHTGVLSLGDVFTSHFVVADDWTNPNAAIRLGANGKFTTQGTGTIVNAIVINVPNAAFPWLGLELRS